MTNNIFKYLNCYFLVYVDDILAFSKTIEQNKDDAIVVIKRCIDHGMILAKNMSISVVQKIEVLGLAIKAR